MPKHFKTVVKELGLPEVSEGNKRCRKCLLEKSILEFPVQPIKRFRDGRHPYCLQCRSLVNRFWKYGVTEEELVALYEKQDGRCAICPTELSLYDNVNRGTVLDHNHETKIVRGLLCNPCNRGLGQFKDNPDLLEKAASYLRGAE